MLTMTMQQQHFAGDFTQQGTMFQTPAYYGMNMGMHHMGGPRFGFGAGPTF